MGRTTPPLVPCEQCGHVHLAVNGVSPGCVAHKKDGTACKQPRPQGGTVCRYHGGAAPHVKAKAAERVVEARARQELVTLGVPVPVDPARGLLEQVAWSNGHLYFLREQLQREFPDEGSLRDLVWGETRRVDKGSGKHPGEDITEEVSVSIWWKLYSEERDRFVAVCATALRAGVEERRLQLATRQGNLVGDVLKEIFNDLGLTPQQWELVPKVVPSRLRALMGAAA